jgi:hypothetical protein
LSGVPGKYDRCQLKFQKQHDKLMKVFQQFKELFQKEMQYLDILYHRKE